MLDGRNRQTAFPGLYCPGLIEAQGETQSGISSTSQFPGLYCPGLIEARPTCSTRLPWSSFPGLYCPGLIEAAAPMGPCDAARTVSGALLPRPH